MVRLATALLTGTLFGLGLAISQMIDPNKVINFLDVFGTWDPSLALVMIGALAVNIVAYYFTKRRSAPVIQGEIFHRPSKTTLDKPLIIGALLFGAGWGIAGYCPGPAFTSISFGNADVFYLLVAYFTGTAGTKIAMHAKQRRQRERSDEACVG